MAHKILHKNIHLPARIKKMLVVKPSSLGDVVHSLPFLNVIKSYFFNSEIHWVIAKGIEGLLEGHPMIDKLWIIGKDDWKKLSNVKRTISEIRNLWKDLKKEKFDFVIDLQGLLRSGLITVATGSRVRVGFGEAREGSKLFYTHRVKTARDIHAVERNLKVAEFLGCDTSPVFFPFPLYYPNPSIMSALPDNYGVFAPGARWETKKWPAERFGRLASLLTVPVVIIGNKSDKVIAEEIVNSAKGEALSLAGETSLKELMEVIKRARFVVSNDSGPMHIAAALGIPVFAIFGPTDPVRTGPYGKGHTVIRADVSCSPCLKKTCEDLKCMRSISAERVCEAMSLRLSSYLPVQ
ncbi:MAG: lipopolysaccharide heptosyltransferase I [Nitrospirota bacterium]